MSIRHHPSPQLRADFVAADLSPGAALAVSLHLEVCSACAVQVQALTGMPVEAGSLPPPLEGAAPRTPELLRGRPLGPWRWIAPGLKGAELKGVNGLGEAVWLLNASRGAGLPKAAGLSLGLLVVLEGTLKVGGDELGPGDLMEVLDPQVRIQASNKAGVCLVTTDQSWPAFGLARFFPPR